MGTTPTEKPPVDGDYADRSVLRSAWVRYSAADDTEEGQSFSLWTGVR